MSVMGERQFMLSQTYKIHEEHSEAKTEDLTHAPPVSSFLLFIIHSLLSCVLFLCVCGGKNGWLCCLCSVLMSCA